jgi:outer membrane protease
MLKRKVVVVCAILYFCLLNGIGSAQLSFQQPTDSGFSQSFGTVKFFNSFTSYEFPSPFPPNQDPLSRLEFPIDQWFLGGAVTYTAPSWIVRAEGWINLNKESGLMMQDSDWDDDFDTSQKTIFSESKCRLNRGTLVDIGCSISTPLEQTISIRPVIGYRYQYFSFTTHDGFQASLDGVRFDLPGDGIDFRQSFEHLYLGGSWEKVLAFPTLSGPYSMAKLGIQFDYALVRAKNEDLHLLRTGDHKTADTTRGHCWHLTARIDCLASDSVRARVSADFKRVLTDGSHRLTNSLYALDFSWDGSHVWSDQASLMAEGILSF